ncbi:hypothetical protein Tco_1073581 [Tanacetum coccineum]
MTISFWVDASVFPLVIPWHNDKTLSKDPHPTPAEFNTDVCNYLADNPAPFRKFSKPFFCFVGISRYYDLDKNCYPIFWAIDDEGKRQCFSMFKVLGNDDCGMGRVYDIAKADQMSKWEVVAGNFRRLSEASTLAVEVGCRGLATVPFIYLLCDPQSEHSSHELNENDADDEVTSIVRSSMPPPLVLTAVVSTTIIASATSAPVHESVWSISVPRQTCLGAEVRMQLEHEIRGRKRFEGRCAIQDGWLKERDAEIASLKAQLSLKEAEVAEAIRLRGQVSIVKLSCDELSVKASSLEFEKDKLEQIEVVQDVQVKVLSDRVAELDAELMRMALHLDEEFYPRYLTTIATRRWILSRGLRPVGIHDGLVAGIDHGKAGCVLAEVAAYDPAAEANYVVAVNALRAVDFPFLAQLASHKDSSMSDLMDLLRLEGLAAETLKAEQLQPSIDQLMLPIHRLEDQVVIGETSFSFSLDLAYARVRKLKESAASRWLSISDALVPIVEPLSAENLVGEAITSGVPAAVATTIALSTTFVEAGSVPPIPHTEAPPSSIVFEKEELDTTPEHPTVS